MFVAVLCRIFWGLVQHLSHSIIHSVQEWTWVSRKSDSAAVSESISSSMTNLSQTGLPALVPDISPDFHTWEDHLSSMFHSEKFDELAPNTPCTCLLHIKRAQRYVLTFRFGPHPGFQMQSTQARSDPLHGISIPNSSSALILWLFLHLHLLVFFFDIALTLLMELKWLMLNRHKRWFHSSRLIFPLLVCLRVGFWCQCIWVESWRKNWFYQTTNQEQLCGFWKHDSLSDFSPLWSSWSLLRCLRRCTT